jgi:hypothetical protein
MSLKKIQRIIAKLVDEKVIMKSTFNKKGYDRTLWYTIIDPQLVKYFDIPGPWNESVDELNGQNDQENTDNVTKPFGQYDQNTGQNDQMDMDNVTKPIPINNTIEIINKNTIAQDELKIYFDQFWKVYPRKITEKSTFKEFKALVQSGENPERLIEAAKLYAEECTEISEQFIKYPVNFLSSHMWKEYLSNRAEFIEKKNQILEEQKKREQVRAERLLLLEAERKAYKTLLLEIPDKELEELKGKMRIRADTVIYPAIEKYKERYEALTEKYLCKLKENNYVT